MLRESVCVFGSLVQGSLAVLQGQESMQHVRWKKQIRHEIVEKKQIKNNYEEEQIRNEGDKR